MAHQAGETVLDKAFSQLELVSLLTVQAHTTPSVVSAPFLSPPFQNRKKEGRKGERGRTYLLLSFLFILTRGRVYVDFKEGGGERDRNIDVREKHRSVGSCMCLGQVLHQHPRYVPWLGIEPTTFWCAGRCSDQSSHQSGAVISFHPSGAFHELRDESKEGSPASVSCCSQRQPWELPHFQMRKLRPETSHLLALLPPGVSPERRPNPQPRASCNIAGNSSFQAK